MDAFLKKLLEPHWYLLLAAAFSLVLVFSLYKPLTEFYVLDPLPDIRKFEETGNYKKVNVGLNIKNFGKFDVQKNTFLMDAGIWFTFDPNEIKEQTISDFRFDQAELLYTSTPYALLVGDKKMIWYDIRVRFSTDLNYHLFPIDDHLITLVLNNKSLIEENAIFVTKKDDFQYLKSLHMHGWEIVDRHANYGYRMQPVNFDDKPWEIRIPKVVFTLDCSRTGIRHLMIIMLPMFVIYCISLISFLLNIDRHQEKIIEIISASLAGLIGYRFVLESMSPTVDYFMISDYIYLIFLAALFILFLMILLHKYISAWLRSLLLIFCNLSIVALWVYYFNIWLVPV